MSERRHSRSILFLLLALLALLAAACAPSPIEPAVASNEDTAAQTFVLQEPAAQEESEQTAVEFSGKIEAITDTDWTVDGRTIVITEETAAADAAVGDEVEVRALQSEQGALTALTIERDIVDDVNENDSINENDVDGANENDVDDANENDVDNANENDDDSANENDDDHADKNDDDGNKTKLSGVVDKITGSVWTIAGQDITITSDTKIQDQIAEGDVVGVHAMVDEAGVLTALSIELDDGGDDDAISNDDDDDANNNDDAANEDDDANNNDDDANENEDDAGQNNDDDSGHNNDDDSGHNNDDNGGHNNDDDGGHHDDDDGGSHGGSDDDKDDD